MGFKLDRDIAYDFGAVEELQQVGCKLLKSAQSITDDMCDNLNQIPGILSELPPEVTGAGLRENTEDTIRALRSNNYAECEHFLRSATDKILNNMPEIDRYYATQFNDLSNTTRQTTSMIRDLREHLESINFGDYDSVSASIDAYSAKWQAFSSDVSAHLTQMLANLKGMKIGCCEFGGDPVNLNTGNFIYEKEDIKLNGVMPITFKRFYNSIDKRHGALGSNWCHNFETRLIIPDEMDTTQNKITFINEEGKEDVFVLSEQGKYVPLNHSDITFKRDDDGGYIAETLTGYKYIFNHEGKNTRQEDSNGNRLNLKYIDDKLTSVTNETGEGLTFKYDDENYLKEVKDHSGRTFRYNVEKEALKSVTNPLLQTTTYKTFYTDELHEITNANNVLMLKNKYDNSNRISRQEFPDGSEMSYEYDDSANKTIFTEQNGNKITYIRDDKYRNIRSIYSDGEEKFAYNSMNQRTMKIDKLGNCTNIKYDNRGNLTGLIDAEGNKYVITYDSNNKPINIKLNDELKMKNSFDSKGNLIETVDALKRKTSFEYNEMGKLTRIIRPDKSVVEMEYDKRGNMILHKEGKIEIKYEYDELNRVVKEESNDGSSMKYRYNAKDQVEREENELGQVRQMKYNGQGKIIHAKDFDGSVLKAEYNEMGLATKLVDQDGGVTKIEHDQMWNISKKIDPNGKKTEYIYNDLNRLEKIVDNDGKQVKLDYDAGGNLTKQILPDGSETSYEYDKLNRITKVVDNGVENSCKYDSLGNITEIKSPKGTAKIDYDTMGNPVKIKEGNDNITELQYNEMNQLTAALKNGKPVDLQAGAQATSAKINKKNSPIDIGVDTNFYEHEEDNVKIEGHVHTGGDIFVQTNYLQKEPTFTIDFAGFHAEFGGERKFEIGVQGKVATELKEGELSIKSRLVLTPEGIEKKEVVELDSQGLKKVLPEGFDLSPYASPTGSATITAWHKDWKQVALEPIAALFALQIQLKNKINYGRLNANQSIGGIATQIGNKVLENLLGLAIGVIVGTGLALGICFAALA